MEEILATIGATLAATIRFATPLVFAALGGMFSERSGVVNIGLEGLMLIGAFAGVVGASLSGSVWIGLLFALGAGLLFALIHAVMCVTFEADQIISGTAINLLALGGTAFLMVIVFGALASGAQQMQFDTQVPLDLTTVLLAVILLFVTATKLVELVLGKRVRELAAGTRLERGLGS